MKEIEEIILKNATWNKYCMRYFGSDKCQGVDESSFSFYSEEYG